MFERIKELVRRKPATPPKEPEPVEQRVMSPSELLPHSLVPLMHPREAVLIEITKSTRLMTPKLFLMTHWPYKKVVKDLLDVKMLQRIAMIPYRALQDPNSKYRMLKVPLQDGWMFHVGTNASTIPSTQPAEMFMYLDDPDWELVDVMTHQLTPKGSLLVKRVCLATMSSIMDYHVVKGMAFFRLKPPVAVDLYNVIEEAATSILGKK